MDKYLILAGIILISLTASIITHPASTVSAQPPTVNDVLEAPQPIKTPSRFSTKLEEITQKLERKTIYKDDPKTEIGEEKILEVGKDGKKTKIYKLTFFEGEEYSRELLSTEVENPADKIISKGTKIVWRTLQIAEGEIKYWQKIRVWATHYDSHCPGCNEWTATGMRQGKGVIAVDPSVIKMRSKLYIPGYGQAIAGDTGGAIKGNIIDLGFDDAHTAGWSAHFIDVYLE